MHSQKKAEHPGGPFLMKDDAKEDEFAQEMGVAKAVAAGQDEIAAQTIMDEASGEAGEDVEMANSVDPAFFVDTIPGQKGGADGVEPVKLSGDAQAAFVGMGDGGIGKKIHDAGFKTGEGVENGGEGGLNGIFADGLSEEIQNDLTDPIQGDELLSAQINEEGVETGPVLRLGINPFGKFRRHFAAGGRANLDFDAVLGHDQFLRRQIEDLPGFVAKKGLMAKRSAATARATLQAMNADSVGLGHL